MTTLCDKDGFVKLWRQIRMLYSKSEHLHGGITDSVEEGQDHQVLHQILPPVRGEYSRHALAREPQVQLQNS